MGLFSYMYRRHLQAHILVPNYCGTCILLFKMICIVMNFRKTWLIANSQKFPKCKHPIKVHTISISSQTPHHISWDGKNKNLERCLSFKRPVFENLGEFSLIQLPYSPLLLSLQAPYPILGLRVTNLKIAPFLSHRPTCTCTCTHVVLYVITSSLHWPQSDGTSVPLIICSIQILVATNNMW